MPGTESRTVGVQMAEQRHVTNVHRHNGIREGTNRKNGTKMATRRWCRHVTATAEEDDRERQEKTHTREKQRESHSVGSSSAQKSRYRRRRYACLRRHRNAAAGENTATRHAALEAREPRVRRPLATPPAARLLLRPLARRRSLAACHQFEMPRFPVPMASPLARAPPPPVRG